MEEVGLVNDYQETVSFGERGEEKRNLYEKYAVENERLRHIGEQAKKGLIELHRNAGVDISEMKWPDIYFVNKKDRVNIEFKDNAGGGFDHEANAVVVMLEDQESDEYLSVIKLYHELA